MRSTTASIVGNMMCMDLVQNPAKHGNALEACRKVCGYMAKKLGISREDLPTLTRSKLDSLTSTSEAPILAQENSVVPPILLGIWDCVVAEPVVFHDMWPLTNLFNHIKSLFLFL